MKKIKVLLVNDSLVFCEVLARGISSDLTIEVVAKAVDPFVPLESMVQALVTLLRRGNG